MLAQCLRQLETRIQLLSDQIERKTSLKYEEKKKKMKERNKIEEQQERKKRRLNIAKFVFFARSQHNVLVPLDTHTSGQIEEEEEEFITQPLRAKKRKVVEN